MPKADTCHKSESVWESRTDSSRGPSGREICGVLQKGSFLFLETKNFDFRTILGLFNVFLN